LNAFFVTDNGGGVYTVDAAVLGTPCGLTTSGEVFTVDLVGHADGQATLRVLAVRSRDCATAIRWPLASLSARCRSDRPAAITSLPPNAGRGQQADSTTRVLLGWSPGSGGQVDLYRAPRRSRSTRRLAAAARPRARRAWVLVATIVAGPRRPAAGTRRMGLHRGDHRFLQRHGPLERDARGPRLSAG
jgi:hypothetical protein